MYADLAGVCRRQIIIQSFDEGIENAVSENGHCCDVCDQTNITKADCTAEFEIAANAIQTLGPRGEVKLVEWIRGHKRGWMENYNTSVMSFAHSLGHSECWWRAFLRKCHCTGILRRKLCNMIKANQDHAILAVYEVTSNGHNILQKGMPVIVSDRLPKDV